MKRLTALFLVLGMLLVLPACGGGGNGGDTPSQTPEGGQTAGSGTGEAEYTVTVSLTTADDSACNKVIYYLADQVEEKSGGRIVFDVHPNGTLANDTGSVEGVQMGTIGMTLVSSANYTQFDSNQAVFDLPFLFPSKEDAYAFLDSDVAAELAASLEDYGFHCFGYMDYGYRLLTNSVKEVKSLEDLKGMKIRTMSSTYQVQTWECLGTNPTVISFSELFTALQQKTVDGQENPWGNIVSQKFYEVQKYATDTHHILTICPMVISKDIYDSMPEDLQAILTECARDALLQSREMVNEEEAASAQIAADAGTIITSMPEEEIAKMRQACQPVYDSMAEEAGEIVHTVESFFQ